MTSWRSQGGAREGHENNSLKKAKSVDKWKGEGVLDRTKKLRNFENAEMVYHRTCNDLNATFPIKITLGFFTPASQRESHTDPSSCLS
jgi:hypothetical protein